jgi:hypothetical protein
MRAIGAFIVGLGAVAQAVIEIAVLVLVVLAVLHRLGVTPWDALTFLRLLMGTP